LLDKVSGRSKAVFTTWLQAQSPASRAGVETVAMDGFTGYKSAAAEALPAAVTVMDLFHVVAPAGDALDRCRQRLQQATCGHRGRTGDPLYGIRRVLRTGAELLTDRQRERLTAVVTVEAHVQGEATWGIYQRIVTAYRKPDRHAAKTALATVIDALSHDVPPALTELITLGRTLRRRAPDVLAYFDRPGKSAPPRPSTAAASISAAPPSASATSPTTSPDHCSTPAASDPDYTLFCDEPNKLTRSALTLGNFATAHSFAVPTGAGALQTYKLSKNDADTATSAPPSNTPHPHRRRRHRPRRALHRIRHR